MINQAFTKCTKGTEAATANGTEPPPPPSRCLLGVASARWGDGAAWIRRTAVLDICGECIICFVSCVYLLTRVRGG